MSLQSDDKKNIVRIDIVDGETVRKCLAMEDCIRLVTEAMVALYQQRAILSQRMALPLFSDAAHLLAMPGAMQVPAVSGIKNITLYPANPLSGLPAIQGLMTLFDLQTGTPKALVDAASITAIRTAAASAAATRVLAREDATSLALLGTGIQAETHFDAMLAVRPVDRVTIWGRSSQKAEALAERLQRRSPVTIEVAANVCDAVRGVDIVCTLTGSPVPILQGQWLTPGTHINMVGAHSPEHREVDSDTIQCARLFVETLAGALQEAGDIVIPLRNGEIQQTHIIAEIAEVFLGKIPGRTKDNDITAYKSLGNATQDLTAACEALRQAQRSNNTKSIEFCQ